jgi:hypothetical protein
MGRPLGTTMSWLNLLIFHAVNLGTILILSYAWLGFQTQLLLLRFRLNFCSHMSALFDYLLHTSPTFLMWLRWKYLAKNTNPASSYFILGPIRGNEEIIINTLATASYSWARAKTSRQVDRYLYEYNKSHKEFILRGFIISIMHIILLRRLNRDGWDGTCSMHRRNIKYIQHSGSNIETHNTHKNLGLDGMLILEWIM